MRYNEFAEKASRKFAAVVSGIIIWIYPYGLSVPDGCPNCGFISVSKPKYDLCPFCGWGPDTEPEKSAEVARKEFLNKVMFRAR